CVTTRKCDELFVPAVEDRIRSNNERITVPTRLRSEGGINFGRITRVEHSNRQSERLSGTLHVPYLRNGRWITWIDDQQDGRGFGQHLLQEAEPFAAQSRCEKRDAGGISARPVEA